MRIPVFSFHEPWLSAMLLGLKKWDTRPWGLDYRGMVGLHLVKGKPFGVLKERAERLKALLPEQTGFKLTPGCIVAVGNLTQTLSTQSPVSTQERQWGDYGVGRSAMNIVNIRVLPCPVPIAGHQTVWYWDSPAWVQEFRVTTVVVESHMRTEAVQEHPAMYTPEGECHFIDPDTKKICEVTKTPRGEHYP